MKKIIHVLVTAALHGLWVVPLWVVSVLFSILLCAILQKPDAVTNRVVLLEGLACMGLWVLLVVHKATEQ